MRVVIITEKYPPIVGGGETHLEQLATGLVAAGHDVTVGTDRLGMAPPAYREGVRLIAVPGLAEACTALSCYRAVESIHRLLITEPADLVHVINYIPALIVSWLRPAIQTRVLFSAFETLIPSKRVFGLFNDYDLEATLQRSLIKGLRPDILICGSQAYKRWALAAGFEERTLRVIPHSTDLERFAFSSKAREAFRQQRGWPADEFVFLVPARPVPRKRIEDVLSAVAALYPRYRLSVVLTAPTGRGDPEYVKRLEAQIRTSDIETCVRWERDLAWSDMPALYSASDAVVLPSDNEGFGIAILEAMAASRPVISTDIEGPNEIIKHESTGHLYPARNVEALTSTMTRVMSEDSFHLVKRSLERVKAEFSQPIMVNRYIDVYTNG